MKLNTRWSVLAAAAFLGGCSLFGGDDGTVEPPAELQDFEESLEVRRLWSTKIGGPSEGFRLGLRPASDGARVYAGAYDGKVEALNAETGRTEWATDTRAPLAAGPGFGNGLLAFGTTDGELLVLDAETGEERWRRQVGSEVLASPAIGSNIVVLRSVDGRLRGFSASDGNEIWTVEQTLPALILRGDTAPHIAGQLVVTGFDNGRIGAYQISNGEPAWELPIANPTGRNELDRLVDISAGLQVLGNDVYAVGYQGRAVSVDLNTGLVLWQQDMSSFAGLDVDLNHVYITNDVSAVIALNRRDGVQAWSQEALRLRDLTAPTRYGNAVVVGDFEGYLHWLSVDDGRFLAREKAGSTRIATAPLVVGRSLVVQSEDGRVAAYTLVDDEAA